MAQKIKVIKEVPPSMEIVTRTYAATTVWVNKANERATLYLEAGADVIFIEALISMGDFVLMGKSINAPLFANMT